ncbi:Sterile alpha motif SAM [Echinococcus multilocularis]|uniref:Sterile alpha motif SAM n=1 Tax=Echinococcus multilocularis TaxID=6211 RepID=A0A087VXR6_ECHMU|nr:Sterile alpha motif SAM [Echinococcus multilocularis]
MRDSDDIYHLITQNRFAKALKRILKYARKDSLSEVSSLCSYSQWCEIIHNCIASSSQSAGTATTRQSAHSCLKSLLQLQFSEQSTVRDLQSFINHAASIGNLEAVRVLLTPARGQWSPAILDDIKATALHAAARHGLMEMIQWLVEEEDADVLAATTTGQTALDFAVEGKHRGVIRYLLPRVINSQLQPNGGEADTPRIRRTRSVSLADARLPQSQTQAFTKLSDPLRRRSAHFNQQLTCREHTIYSNVCEAAASRPLIASNQLPSNSPINSAVALRTKPPTGSLERNSLPPICPNRRILPPRFGHPTLPFAYHSQCSMVRMPTGLATENLTSTQHQAMFSCLGKGNPGVEGDSSSAGRRHTMGGSASVTGRSKNLAQSPFSQISPARHTQTIPSPWAPQAGTHSEVVKARATASFHGATCRSQSLCFNEGDIIGVFADSMTSKEDSAWWRGFRFANGPSGDIGMFPSSHVTLLPRQPPPPPATQTGKQKKKSDFSAQTDVESSCSSSTEDDGDEEAEGGGSLLKKDATTVASDNEEAPHVNEAKALCELETLTNAVLPVPLRSSAAGRQSSTSSSPSSTTMTASTPTSGHMNILMDSSNRNSATSLDSGRGSAYATSSEGSKMISTSTCATFPHPHQHLQQVCPTQPLNMIPRVPPSCLHRMTSVTSASATAATSSHPRGGYRAASVQPCASSTCSSASSASSASSGESSCSSCAAAVSSVSSGTSSCDRSPVELLVNWLLSAGFSDYTPCLVAAGYDLSTLRRATPEDLNACGVTHPRDRQQLRARLSRLQLPENLPDYIPSCVFEWLSILNLTSYWPAFQTQGLTTFEKVAVLTWEDLEEIGIMKLGHQKKLVLAIERIRRALSKRNEDQSVGTDSLTRIRQSQQQQHLLSSPSHPAAQPLSIAEEQEATMTGNLADLTPPPPPGFQDPPHVVRKGSLDFSPPCIINPGSPEPRRMSHHRHHFSTSFLTDVGRLGSNAISSVGDPGGEGSTKSDPLPRVGTCEGEGEAEAEGGVTSKGKNSKGHQRGAQQGHAESFLSVRQRHRNAAAAAITIPVSVANQMIPPPTSGSAMDKDLQDMQDIRSMLDKLSEHLVPRGSP